MTPARNLLPAALLAAGVLVLALPAPGLGQAEPNDPAAETPAPRFGESVEVVAVEVPVEVVRHGTAVRGLTRDNFELYEDGERRELSGFEEIDFGRTRGAAAPGAARPGAAESAPAPADRRNLLLLFDFVYSTRGDRLRALDDAHRFVQESLGDADYAAIAVSGGYRAASRLVVPFTRRRDRLLAGLDYVHALESPKPSETLRARGKLAATMASGSADGRLAAVADEVGPTAALAAGSLSNLLAEAPSGAGSSREGPGRGAATEPARTGTGAEDVLSSVVADDPARLAAELAQSALASQAVWQLQGISELVTALRDVPGRKLLVLYSRGFDPALIRDQRSGDRARLLAEMERTFAAARRGGWSVHAIDLGGIPVSGTPASTPLSSIPASTRVAGTPGGLAPMTRKRPAFDADTLFALADATGGVLHENFNDFFEASERVLAETDVSYLLTFQRPRVAEDGNLHKIRIRLVGVPVGAHAYYRNANQARLPESERSATERRLDRAAQILGGHEIGELAVDVASYPRPGRDGRWRTAVELELADPVGTLEPGRDGRLDVEVSAYAIASDLAVADSFSRRLRLDPAKLGAALDGRPLRVVGELVVPAGDYRLRLLVRDATSGRTALHGRNLALAKAQLWPPLVTASGPALALRSQGADPPAAGDPFAPGAEPLTPWRTLGAGEATSLELFAAGLGDEPEAVTLRVLDADGEPVSRSPISVLRTLAAPDGLAHWRARIDGTALAPGHYHVELGVRVRGAAEVLTRSDPFVVTEAAE